MRKTVNVRNDGALPTEWAVVPVTSSSHLEQLVNNGSRSIHACTVGVPTLCVC